MKISLVEKNGKIEWDRFLEENNGSFLQSFDWGEFQKAVSKKVWWLRIEDNDNILTQVLIIKEKFPFGKNCFYIPYGPCFKKELSQKEIEQAMILIFKELKRISQKENSIFLRIEPISSLSLEIESPRAPSIETFPALKRIQPKKTLVLDLSKSREEILKTFHHKTRYNIKLAQKKGVQVKSQISNLAFRQTQGDTEQSRSVKSQIYFNEFYKLVQKTAERDKFKPYPKDYYKKIIEILNSDLFLAIFKERVIAANIMVYFGKRATYLHGASDYDYREFMAPHFLHWQQILTARERGCKEYDFWGIDEQKWPGITRFKKGFGGKEIEYPKGKDFVFQKIWYNFYRKAKKVI